MPLWIVGLMSSHWRSIVAARRYGTGLAHSGGRVMSAQADFVRDSGRILLSAQPDFVRDQCRGAQTRGRIAGVVDRGEP